MLCLIPLPSAQCIFKSFILGGETQLLLHEQLLYDLAVVAEHLKQN